MKIGVMSDTHNNERNTQQALDIMRTSGAERLIHCGDITSPNIVELFEGWQVDFVLGNVDRELEALRRAVGELAHASIGHQFRDEIDGVRLAATHGHDLQLLSQLIRSGNNNYVFHGHSHQRRDELISGTRVVNPGALGGKRSETRSVCVVDLTNGEVEFITLMA